MVQLVFTGGMELLTKCKTKELKFSGNIKSLIAEIATTVDRKDLFVQGESLRPGILVLINDVDWELENQYEYVVKESDTIVFISTLHGG
jgi:ubiquitin related modifier 1